MADLLGNLQDQLNRKGSLPKAEQNELDSLEYKNRMGSTNISSPVERSTTPDVATSQAIENGADPMSLALAKQQLGKDEYVGYCESFVESVAGSGWKGKSAIDAWNNQQDKAVPGLNGVQPGDSVYFYDPNQPYGHTGIYSGDNQFISATGSGIQQSDINKWAASNQQQVLGYVPQGGQNAQN